MKRTWKSIRPSKKENKAAAVAAIIEILDEYNSNEIKAGRRHPATSCNDHINNLIYYNYKYVKGYKIDIGGYAGDVVADVLGCF